MEIVKVLCIMSRSTYGELERRSLYLLSKLAEQPNIDLVVGFLQDNSLRTQLTDLSVKCELFKGYSGLIRYLQFNRFDIINFATSKRLYGLISQHGRNAALVETIITTSNEDSTSNLDRSAIWSIFDDPLLVSQWNSPARSTVLPPAIYTNLLSRSAKGFIKVQHALSNNPVIGVTCYSLEDLDINLLIRLAQTLRAYKDQCKIVIFCNASNHKILTSRLKQANVDDYILVRELVSGVISGIDVYLDTARKTVIRIDVLEALALKVPVVIPQNLDTEKLAKLLNGSGFLYTLTGSIELLRQYCLSALKLDPTTIKLPSEYDISSVVPKLIGVYQNVLLDDHKMLPSAPTTDSVRTTQPALSSPTPSDAPPNISDRTYYIIPYSIHGGGEVYLKNYLQKQPADQVGLIFMSRGTVLEQELRSKYPYAVVNNPVNLGNYILANKIQKVCFYNSKAIYLLLSRLKKMQMQSMFITEIIHSFFQWKDSMHGVDRSDIDRILVVSDAVARQWRLTKYEVAPPSIDENRFKIKKVKSDKTVIGTVARLSPEKNLLRVVDIAAELDDNYQFVIVGQDGGVGTTLRNYINSKGLRKRVVVKDYTSQIEKEYATFNLFLLTSHIEGTPMTILEALAADLPVVAPDVGGIRKMLEGKDKCHTFNVSDSNAFIAQTIKNILFAPPPESLQAPLSTPVGIPPPAPFTSSIDCSRTLVSVIMSTHARNKPDKYCPNQLRRAVDAILNQTHKNLELLICDDGSKDGTAKTLQEYTAKDSRVKVFRFEESCKGFTAIRYTWLRQKASSDLVMEAFDDEEMYPNALLALVEPFVKQPDLDMTYGKGQPIDAASGRPLRVHGKSWSDEIFRDNIVPCGAVLLNRKVHDRIGFGDARPELRRWADNEFWIRMRYNGCKVEFVPVIAGRGWIGNSDSIGATIASDPAFNMQYLIDKYPFVYPENLPSLASLPRPKSAFTNFPMFESKYDLIIVTSIDDGLFFHSCEIMAELFTILGKKVYLINEQNSPNYSGQMSQLHRADKILMYRLSGMPLEVEKAQQSGIPVGFLMDDDTFSIDPVDPAALEKTQAFRKNVLAKVDYCLGNTESLTQILKAYNPKSYCSGSSIFWKELFLKRKIEVPRNTEHSTVRIGLIQGGAHGNIAEKIIRDFMGGLTSAPVTIVYFGRQPLNISLPSNINLEFYPYVQILAFYKKLFELNLDICYVEYFDSAATRSKSNLKFRESAFLKAPLIAVDPTERIYSKEIVNGENGYSVATVAKALTILNKLICDRSEIGRLGENAYNTSIKDTPLSTAQRVWDLIEKGSKKE